MQDYPDMKTAIIITAIALTFMLSSLGWAGIHTESVEYRQGETLLEGYIAYDDANQDKRPGVLVVHEWMGLNDYAKMRAEKLAALGYVAFAADIYGKGVRAKNAEEASALAGKYRRDRNLFRARVNAALEVLRAHLLTDKDRTAAIGYCFGGTAILELARSGADVLGVVSFHGGLSTPTPEGARKIRAKVLVLHGADDPFVPPDEVAAFQNEMNNGGVDWQMVFYSGAVHSFTNPASGNDPSKGVAYNESADRRSWEAMKLFFGELFGK